MWCLNGGPVQFIASKSQQRTMRQGWIGADCESCKEPMAAIRTDSGAVPSKRAAAGGGAVMPTRCLPACAGVCTLAGTPPLWVLINAPVESMVWLAFLMALLTGIMSSTVGPNMR